MTALDSRRACLNPPNEGLELRDLFFRTKKVSDLGLQKDGLACKGIGLENTFALQGRRRGVWV